MVWPFRNKNENPPKLGSPENPIIYKKASSGKTLWGGYKIRDKEVSREYYFKLIIKIILIAVMIVLFFIFFIRTGIAKAVFGSVGTKISSVGGGTWDKILEILNPEKQRVIGSLEDEESVRKDIGIKVNNLRATKKTFYSGESIGLIGTFEAASLLDRDSLVNFNCELEGYGSAENKNIENAIIPADGIKLTQTISCLFEKGLVPKSNLDTREAKFIGSVQDYYSRSTYPVFVLSKEKYDENVDDFRKENIIKNLLGPGNIMTYSYTDGPIEFMVGGENEQPFKEGETNRYFEIKIKPDVQVDLKEVTDFKLYVPSGIIIMHDDEHCKFKKIGNDGNYDIFGLKEEIKNIKGGDELWLGCFFDVMDSYLLEDEFHQDEIIAKMVYSFDITKKASVTVRRSVE